VKKRATLYSLCAAAMTMCGLVLGAGPAAASIHNTPGYIHLFNETSGKCIDAAFPDESHATDWAQQWRCLNTEMEEWKFVPFVDPYGNYPAGLFHIVNNATGECLTQVPTPAPSPDGFSSHQNGDPVLLQPCWEGGWYYEQVWAINHIGLDFQLVSQTYGLRCLDLANSDSSDGVPMRVWDCSPYTNNQRWHY
jgi:hypothetical protein